MMMRVANSMVTVLAGYVAAVVVLWGWFLVVGGEFGQLDVYAFMMVVAVVALYAFPCALLFVLPVWFFLPSQSRYWRTSWATAIGAFFAAIVMIVILVSLGLVDAERDLAGMFLTWATGVVVGAVTGLPVVFCIGFSRPVSWADHLPDAPFPGMVLDFESGWPLVKWR